MAFRKIFTQHIQKKTCHTMAFSSTSEGGKTVHQNGNVRGGEMSAPGTTAMPLTCFSTRTVAGSIGRTRTISQFSRRLYGAVKQRA